MIQIPREHHFVPKSLLKNFCDSNGDLHVWNKGWIGGNSRKKKPGGVFYKKDLHNLRDKNEFLDPKIEHELDSMENNVTPFFTKLIDSIQSTSQHVVTVQERQNLNRFFQIQMGRVPDVLDSFFEDGTLEADAATAVSQYERNFGPISDEAKAHTLDPATLDRINHNARAESIVWNDPQVAEILDRMHLCLMHISNSRKAFVIGSQPVTKIIDGHEPHLGRSGVELHLPISSKVGVILTGTKVYPHRMDISDPAKIRKLNSYMSQRSSTIVSHSSTLTNSLITKVGTRLHNSND